MASEAPNGPASPEAGYTGNTRGNERCAAHARYDSSLAAGRKWGLAATSHLIMQYSLLHRGVAGAASLALANSVLAAKPETRVRAEIPAQYRWDFSAIY